MNDNLEIMKQISSKHERPFYFYEEEKILKQINLLKNNLPQFEFLYSVKTNPYQPIINFIAKNEIGADAASKNEVFIAEKAGISYDKIMYSTPGKTRKDIEETIDKSIIIADSYNEIVMINEIARQKGINVNIGVRINPNYAMDDKKGISSKFGIDEETLDEKIEFFDGLSNVKVNGIHLHIKSQVLNYKSISKYYEKIFDIAMFCQNKMKWKLDFINFGSGIGVAYSKKNDSPFDIDSFGKECRLILDKFKGKIDARFIIESGRFLVCEAGMYVTNIVDIKESRGQKYVIVQNGFNGFIRPAIADMMINYMPDNQNIPECEPLFTKRDAFEVKFISNGDSINEKVHIVGNLCAATDVIVKNIEAPELKIGDIVTISHAGSYAYSLTPLLFASHELPIQIYIDRYGNVVNI